MNTSFAGLGRLAIFSSLFGTAALAHADFSFSFVGTGSSSIDGAVLKSKATFTFTDATDTLLLVLENQAPVAIAAQGNSLSSFFWSVAGNPSITKVSAALGSGANVTLLNVVQIPSSYSLNDEWAYRNNITTYTPNTALRYGVSAAGLAIFGPPDTFSGAGNPDGSAYCIVPSAGVTGAGGTSSRSYVNSSMLFTLNTTAHLSQSDFRQAAFQFGTGLDEPNVLVPEPASLAMFGFGLLGLMRMRRRK